jgi:hypothetical protein
MDKELFEAAFVTCDAVKFRALFTDDAEFYHDRTGAAVGEAARTMTSCPRDNGVTRTLVSESLEVYPMQGYGAVRIGRHTFARKGEPGSEVAKFVHLWKREKQYLAPCPGSELRSPPLASVSVATARPWRSDSQPLAQPGPRRQAAQA